MTRARLFTAAASIGVFVVSLGIAAAFSDAISTDDEFVLEEGGRAIPMLGLTGTPVSTDGDAPDPGGIPQAVLVPAAVPLPPPLLPGGPPADAPVDPALGSAGPTNPIDVTGPTDVTVPTDVTGPTEVTGPTDVPAPATTVTGQATTTRPGVAPGDQTTIGIVDPIAGSPTVGTTYRFFDLCADGQVEECPLGVGGTVLFAGGAAPPPPLAIDMIAEPTQAIRDQIRCELAWPTSVSVPVLLTSNRPLDLYHASLSLGNGSEVHGLINQRSTPAEIAWYDKRVASGTPVGTAVGDGVHTCVEFDLTMPQAPDGIDRNGRFQAEIHSFAGSSTASLVRDFDGNFRSGKPPVRIIPVDGYRAVMIVPQRQDDTVTSTLFASSQDPGLPGTGACPTNPLQSAAGFLVPRKPATAANEVDPALLNDPGYPFDRDYSHYVVWDLYLRSGSDYTVCVAWALDGAREHWLVETPAAWNIHHTVRVLGYNSRVDSGSLSLRVLGIHGCWVATPGRDNPVGKMYGFPDKTLHSTSSWNTWSPGDLTICDSRGWRIPDTIEIEARLTAPGDDAVYGITRIPFDALLNTCVFRSASGTTAECDGPTIEWRIRRVLCGGPIGGGGCGGPDRTLTTWIRLSPDQNNAHASADPKSWSISRVAIVDLSDVGSTVDRVDTPPP